MQPEPYYPPFPCAASGTVRREPLSLERPELKPWLERVSGHHEASLGWKKLYVTDRVRGYDESTTLSMDVVVLAAEDAIYTPGPASECGPSFQRSMDVEVQLATGDGALRGSFRHSLVFVPSYSGEDGAPRLESNQGVSLELESLANTFELEVDPLLGIDPESVIRQLTVFFSFQEDGIHGSLQPMLSTLPDAAGNRHPWAPIEAVFPHDCSEGEALDEVWTELGGAPRALYEAYASRWPTQPMTARYVDPEDFPRSDRPLAETRVTVSVGPLGRVCDVHDRGLRFFGPLLLETADGRVRFAHEMETDLVGHASSLESPLAPAGEFERSLGIQGVDLGTSTHGRVQFSNTFGAGFAEMFGRLRVASASPLERSPVTPALVWCAGRATCEPATEL